MAIEAKCDHCGKKYRLDDKFAGKKAKCKECGQSFVIKAAAAAAVKAAVPAGKATARPAAKPAKVPAKPAAPSRSAPPPSLRANDTPVDDYDLAPSDAPPAGTAVSEKEGRCPGCGADFPDTAVLCVSCGYNRRTGSAVSTQVGGGSKPGRHLIGGAMPSGKPTTANQPYGNAALNTLDTLVPEVVMWGTVLVIVLGLGWAVNNLVQAGAGVVPITIVLGLISLGLLLWLRVVNPIAVWGVRLAGGFMGFEVPDKAYRRLLTVQVVSYFASILIVLVASVVFAVGAAAATGAGGQAAGVFTAMGVLGVLLFLLATLVVQFLIFWFFFRIRPFVQALVGWLFCLLFYVVGYLVSGGIVLGLAYLLKGAIAVSTS